jgi:hypothetical protein
MLIIIIIFILYLYLYIFLYVFKLNKLQYHIILDLYLNHIITFNFDQEQIQYMNYIYFQNLIFLIIPFYL